MMGHITTEVGIIEPMPVRQTEIKAGQNVRPQQLEQELRALTSAPLAVYGDGDGGFFVIVADVLSPKDTRALTAAVAKHVPEVMVTLTEEERAAAIGIGTLHDVDVQHIVSAMNRLSAVALRVTRNAAKGGA